MTILNLRVGDDLRPATYDTDTGLVTDGEQTYRPDERLQRIIDGTLATIAQAETFTAAEAVAVVARANERTLTNKIDAALTTNSDDIDADNTIIAGADAYLAIGSPSNAQIAAQVRALTQAVRILAQHDRTTKRQLSALGRLVAGRLDSTEGT